MPKINSVPYIFEYETGFLLRDDEFTPLRVDVIVEISVSKNYAGVECGCVESIDIIEITDMDSGRDLTTLKYYSNFLDEIKKEIYKVESYLVDKAS